MALNPSGARMTGKVGDVQLGLLSIQTGALSVPDALKHHLSGRLLDWAYIGKTPGGEFHITDLGRQLIKRQNN